MTTLGGTGSYRCTDGRLKAEAEFYAPAGITCDPATNHLYVIEYGGHNLRHIDLASGMVKTVAGNGLGNIDGTGTAASFNNPHAITYDGKENLYITGAQLPFLGCVSPHQCNVHVRGNRYIQPFNSAGQSTDNGSHNDRWYP